MKKIIMIVFLVMNTVSIGYSYDLSTLDGLKQCKVDSNCYACEANGAVSQCVKLSPYDKELGEINSNKYDWVCNVSSKKEMCKEKIDNDIMEEKNYYK